MSKLKKTINKKMTDAERIEFAKQLEDFYEASHGNMKKVFTFSLLRGIATGLGVFLGGTIVVTLLLWAISQLSDLPFIGDISKAAEHSIEQKSSDERT